MAQYSFRPRPPVPLIPAGWYKAQIVSSNLKTTRAGDGRVLTLTFYLLGEGAPKQQLLASFNVENPSEAAVDHAMQKLSMLSESVGKPMWENSRELYNIPLGVRVSIAPASNGYRARNTVAAYCLVEEIGKNVQDTKVQVRDVKVTKGKKGERPKFTDDGKMPF